MEKVTATLQVAVVCMGYGFIIVGVTLFRNERVDIC